MARRSEHSQEEIKKMVLTAAERIVIDNGFADLKVRKVAMDIGYTVGSIYMVFENMADLFMHVKGRTLDDLAEQLTKEVNNNQTEQIIEQLAKGYLQFATQNYNRWSMIFEHSLTRDETLPDWYQEKIDSVFKLIESQFEQLLSSKEKEQNKLAAHTLWSGVHGICTLSLSGKTGLLGTEDVEEAVVLLVRSFIKGWKS